MNYQAPSIAPPHGTSARYRSLVWRCRCRLCRKAAAKDRRDQRAGRKVVSITDLAVYCWCEAEVVHVPPETIKAGRTGSCGNPDCNEERAA